MKFNRFKKKIKKTMQRIGLIKKFSFSSFIKKKLTSAQVRPGQEKKHKKWIKKRPIFVGFVLVLVVVSAYFLFFFSSEVLAEWWDTNWHYRKAITITNSGSAQTDFQVKVLANYDMSTDVTNGKVQADFDDLRFTDINGNALDYWIEDDTAASLDVWVKIDSIPTNTSIVYMYYGNPNVSAVQCGDDTFEFFDDFSGTSLSNYDQVGSDIWGITSGYAHDQTSVNVPGARLLVKSTVYQANDNFMIKVRARQNDNDGAGVVFRSSGGSYYTCNHITEGSGRLIISKDGGGYHTGTSLNYTSYAFVQTTFYTVEARVSGTSISCVANGSAGNVTVNTTDSSYSTGQMGLFAEYLDPYGEFDWLIIGKSATAIPTATPQSEEKGPGPVGYWSFDEGYGTTAQDRTSNNNDGTITGATWQTEDMCVSGKCLYFDGSDDDISVTDSSSLYLSDGFTLSLWMKSSDTSSSLLNKDNNEWSLYLGSDRLYIHLRDDDTTGYIGRYLNNITSLILDDSWHLVTCTWNGTTSSSGVTVFIDGLEKVTANYQSGTFTALRNLNTSLDIGTNFNGFIDEPKVYDYARTVAQIKADYNSGKAGLSSDKGSAVSLGGPTSQGGQTSLSDGLVGYWKMDESSWSGVADEVIDASGNGNHGVRSGGATTTSTAKYGMAGGFDGTGDYVVVGSDDSLDITGNITFGGWMRFNSLVDFAGLIRMTNTYIRRENGGTFRYIFTGLTDGSIFSTTSPVVDTWYHVIGTYDGAQICAYVNGAQEACEASTGTLDGLGGDIDIGRFSDNYHNGSIDEVRIYNRALSSREVKALYEWAPGPVGYWKMDEKVSGNSKTLYDISGNENNGTTYYGANTTGMDCTKLGKYGGGCEFDGVDDYVYSEHDIGTLSTFTVSAWIKFNEETGYKTILNKGISNAGNIHFLLNDGTSTNKPLIIYVDNQYILTSETLLSGQLYFVTATYDGTYIRLYIDGVLKKEGPASHQVAPTEYINIGRRGDGHVTSFFNGIIDDVRIYNYARTQKQILEDMLAGRPASKSPVGYWKFDEGADNTCSGGVNDACDSSGYGNDGSNIGADWTNEGKFGKALSFNGSSDYVDHSNISFDKDESWSFSVWQYKPTGSGTGWQGFIGYDISVSYGGYWLLHPKVMWYQDYYDPGTGYEYYGYHNSNIELGDEIPYDEWYNLTVTYNGDDYNIKVYVNGKFLESDISTWSPRLSRFTFKEIGRGDMSRYFNGKIDEVKVYNYALTEEEIKQEYNQGKVSVMGVVGGDGSGSTSSAGTAEYCVPGSSDSCAPPVAEWNFDEKTGDYAYDTSGNGNTGTLTNMEVVDWKSAGDCHSGACLDFDGESEYVNGGTDSSLDFGTGDATIETWFKISTDGGALVTKRAGSGFQIYVLSNKFYADGAGTAGVYSVSNLNDDTWHHGAAVYDRSGALLRLYVDGVADNTVALGSTSLTDAANLNIGRKLLGGAGDYFNGKIDQVRIYNYARTPTQIAWDYNKGKPVAHWRFDEGQGTTLYDESDNDNDGTLSLGSLGQTSAGSVKVNANTAWYNGREGKQNYSLNFDGSDDYVDCGNIGLGDSVSAFSVSFWMKGIDGGPFSFGIVGSTANYLLLWHPSNLMKLEVRGTTGSDNIYSTTNPFDNEWHHITFTKSGTSGIIYIDGASDATGVVDGVYNLNIDTLIGRYGGTSEFFDGQIDEVKIFNYALSPLQIKTEYNMGAARLGTGN